MQYSSISSRSRSRFFLPASFVALPLLGFIACSAPAPDGDDSNPDSTPDVGDDVGDDIGDIDGAGSGGGGQVAVIEKTLPAGFTQNTLGVGDQVGKGGYKIVGKLSDYEEPQSNSCANVLKAVIRDFQPYCTPVPPNGNANECANGSPDMLAGGHIDFGRQKPTTWTAPGLYTGMVAATLGDDRKPVATGTAVGNVDDLPVWYNEKAAGATYDMESYVMDMWLEPFPADSGSYVFDANNFFPLEGSWDAHPANKNYGGDGAAQLYNFAFTIEIHTAFAYKGGQVFNFRGDDDVWVFIDKKLVVDIGGIHGPLDGNVNLDTLGLEVGKVYDLDLFQAERHPGGSNFKIDTSLDFQSCAVIPGGIK